MYYLFVFLSLFVLVWVLVVKLSLSPRQLRHFLISLLGISLGKVRRVFIEIHRKTFHFLGLLFPIVYYFVSRETSAYNDSIKKILLVLVSIAGIFETARKISPAFNLWFVKSAGKMLREKEHNAVTAVTPYLVGVTLTIWFFEPRISLAAMLNLVLGDGAAALVGVSFGRHKLPGGKKSIEGSLSMFLVCLIHNAIIFWSCSRGVEVFALINSIVAVVFEYYGAIDDNISIPVMSALAMKYLSWRLGIEIPPL